MRKEIGPNGTTIVVFEPGDTATQLGGKLTEYIETSPGGTTIVLDLRGVNGMPPQTIRDITDAYGEAAQSGRTVRLMLSPDTDDATHQTLNTVGIPSWMPIYTPEEV